MEIKNLINNKLVKKMVVLKYKIYFFLRINKLIQNQHPQKIDIYIL
jgi:hypothetical protein